MPKYFFHVRDSVDCPDLDGTELEDDLVAKSQAVVLSGELLKDLGGRFWEGADWKLMVMSDDGRTVCQLVFKASAL